MFSTKSKKNGKTYYLHSRNQLLRGGKTVTLYFFAGKAGPGACDMPTGKEIGENERTGLPFLRNKL